jgi:aminoglycoside phosphotransferase (APT) family kinase protein
MQVIEPGCRVLAVSLAPGSFSNTTHVVDAQTVAGTDFRLVVRRFTQEGDDQQGKARREFCTLELLQGHNVLAPEPLYLDADGSQLDYPGFVSRFVAGSQNLTPADPLAWAQALAHTLAHIHAVPCDPAESPFLLNATTNALWFLRYRSVPPFMAEHPDGAKLWDVLRDKLMYLRPVKAGLVHMDYWAGNMLWQSDQITAVVDWEEAGYGEPGVDVGYAYHDMFSLGSEELAAAFLAAYEAEAGRKVENLAFWRLAAAVRQMPDPARWLPEVEALGKADGQAERIRTRLRQFIAAALEELSAES